ncbi:MAG TPA: DNA mismatch repair endonuclease MutL [Spirochaetota bacterium]|nr:DNA mismatch repair endonuclease MutL [Spirochaetota bacterium]
MKRIILLPDHIKHMIAAGEVVEGPFSVVKELIENSIDAGASAIDVQIYDSGLKKIIVRDDGSGILKDDIALSIEEHATSKITDSSGLHNVTTYGFRGEALSSISSISDMVILSKTSGEAAGSRLESAGGKVTITDFAGMRGTTVIVENLFYNMPARKKFLKSKKTELRSIRETILKMALPSYNTAFTFDVDGKREISLPAAKTRDERIQQIFGKTILQSLYLEELIDLKVRLKGYLSKPDFMKSSRNMQFIFVNNRPIEYKFLSFHLSRAYEAVIPKGKYPAAIIFIEIDPELIDVNIHPAKREVKLFDQKYIDEMIFNLASKSLNKPHSIPDSFFKTAAAEPDIRPVFSERDTFTLPQKPVSLTAAEYLPEPSYSGSLFDPNEVGIPVNPEFKIDKGLKILGTLFDTYILIEDDDKLHLIDFHAAHERILYDKLKISRNEIEYQELIFPVSIELSIDEFALVADNIEIFNEIGFEIEEFSDYTIIVRSVPVIAGNDKINELIKNMIDNIKDGIKSNDLMERFYSLIACHSAKRAGDKMSRSDMETLTRMVMDGGIELRCPHGRPFFFTINQNDLERIFKRI